MFPSNYTVTEHRGTFNNPYLPSLSSIVIERDTTSRDAKSLAVGAYLSMNLSPALLRR